MREELWLRRLSCLFDRTAASRRRTWTAVCWRMWSFAGATAPVSSHFGNRISSAVLGRVGMEVHYHLSSALLHPSMFLPSSHVLVARAKHNHGSGLWNLRPERTEFGGGGVAPAPLARPTKVRSLKHRRCGTTAEEGMAPKFLCKSKKMHKFLASHVSRCGLHIILSRHVDF